MYILSKTSGTGSTKWMHSIGFEPDAKDWAAGLLLRNELHLQDEDFLKSYNGRMQRIEFSRSVLTQWKKLLGTLSCVYCPKKDLIIEYEGMKVSPHKLATLEHVMPTSKDGDVFSLDNVVCACGKCNTNRGNKDFETYIINKAFTPERIRQNCEKYYNLKSKIKTNGITIVKNEIEI